MCIFDAHWKPKKDLKKMSPKMLVKLTPSLSSPLTDDVIYGRPLIYEDLRKPGEPTVPLCVFEVNESERLAQPPSHIYYKNTKH